MKSHLLINEPPLQVLPSLAMAIGLNEAIVIQQLHYWLENPKCGVERDGFKWIFNTYEEWHENFPFWSVSTIQRIFSGLEKNGLVIAEQLDKHKHDMKKFYRLNYDELCKMDDVKMESSEISHRHDVNRNTETTAETKEEGKFPENTSIEWYIVHNLPVPEHLLHNTQQDKAALDTFEQVFGYGSLPWDSTSVWTKFHKFIVKVYAENPNAFTEYIALRASGGKYDAMSPRKIRENPQMFMDTGWPNFLVLAHSAMYQKPAPSKPLNLEVPDAIPNPGKKPDLSKYTANGV